MGLGGQVRSFQVGRRQVRSGIKQLFALTERRVDVIGGRCVRQVLFEPVIQAALAKTVAEETFIRFAGGWL